MRKVKLDQNARNRPRPVKVNFPNFASRQAVWKSRFSLKGTPFSMSEDLPISIRIQRAKMRHERVPTSPTSHLLSTTKQGESRPKSTPVAPPGSNSPLIPSAGNSTNSVSPPNPRPKFSLRRKTLPLTPKVHPFFTSAKDKNRKRK